ncbi:MAG: hypothetical protein H7263_06770, partial [Candidatus Sericytochromatia bacterium]|nr:hypothetical protein [Candidatus Sericytochromatia bacterium]
MLSYIISVQLFGCTPEGNGTNLDTYKHGNLLMYKVNSFNKSDEKITFLKKMDFNYIYDNNSRKSIINIDKNGNGIIFLNKKDEFDTLYIQKIINFQQSGDEIKIRENNISFDKVSINSKGNELLILHKKDGNKYKLLIKKIKNYNI